MTLVVNNDEKCDLLYEQCWMQRFERAEGVPYTCSSCVVLFGRGGSEHETEKKKNGGNLTFRLLSADY